MEMKDEGPVKIVQAKARSRSNKKEVIDVFNEIRQGAKPPNARVQKKQPKKKSVKFQNEVEQNLQASPEFHILSQPAPSPGSVGKTSSPKNPVNFTFQAEKPPGKRSNVKNIYELGITIPPLYQKPN